jgi:hypothetical protein
MTTSGPTYQVTILPVRESLFDWQWRAVRLSDDASVTRNTLTHWGAKRVTRKKNLDKLFAKYVDTSVREV